MRRIHSDQLLLCCERTHSTMWLAPANGGNRRGSITPNLLYTLVPVCGTISDTKAARQIPPTIRVGWSATPSAVCPTRPAEGGRHGRRSLIRLLGAAAAQGARPDPGRAGAPGRLRRDH